MDQKDPKNKARVLELYFIPSMRPGKCHSISVKINRLHHKIDELSDLDTQSDNSLLIEEGTSRLLNALFDQGDEDS